MKRALNNPNLWQKKRSQLPVDGNPDMDWLHIRDALDKRMPVSAPVKKPYRFKSTKWWFNGLIVATSAIVIYAVVQLYFSNKQHATPPQHHQNINRDSAEPQRKDSSLVTRPDSGKSITVDSSPIKPAKTGAQHTTAGLLQNDTSARSGRNVIDTDKTPHAPNTPHRDSLISPANTHPVKTIQDSVKPPVINNKIIRKDTSKTDKNGPKKHRRKLSIFT